MTKSKTISENMNPTFNHTVVAKVFSGKNLVPVALKLMDDDTAPNNDDLADINPLSGTNVLTLNYEPDTGSVYGPDGKKLGLRGQLISLKGDKDKQGVEITFAINHKDTFGFISTAANRSKLPNHSSKLPAKVIAIQVERDASMQIHNSLKLPGRLLQ